MGRLSDKRVRCLRSEIEHIVRKELKDVHVCLSEESRVFVRDSVNTGCVSVLL